MDYLRYDNCNDQGVEAIQRYTTMRDALRAATEETGHPIVHSICEWGENRPWEWAEGVGPLWRTRGDISDDWGSVLPIMKRSLPLAQYAGPGHWNDPDMLEVGNGDMTDTEYRTRFSMWSVMAAPLLIGSALREAPEATFEILGNREVIAVDQEPLGEQGRGVSSDGGRRVAAKEMRDGSRMVALFSESSSPQRVATTTRTVGLFAAAGYTSRDLWEHRTCNTAGTLAAAVPAHGTVLLRVRADFRWAHNPPAVEYGPDSRSLVEAGRPAPLDTHLTTLGRTPIPIKGRAYEKVLGVHAESKIEYRTGGHCSAITAEVVVDDKEGAWGTVAFQSRRTTGSPPPPASSPPRRPHRRSART